MTQLTFRAFAGELLPPVVHLLQRELTAEPLSQSLFTRKVLLDPNVELQGMPVACRGDQVVGFGLSIARKFPLEDATPDNDIGYITLLAVDAAVQKQGIGAKLLAHMEQYLQSRGRKKVMVSSYAPNYFTPGVDVNAYPGGLQFFLKHGYQEVYRPLSMECPLQNLRVPDWVQARQAELAREGVMIETYRPELIPALFEFLKQEFVGEWQRFAREAIGRIESGDAPDRVWIAHERGQVIGFSHYEQERFGPIGVSVSERGRGIGQALLYRTLSAMRQRGLHIAYFMWSDDRTAERLYNEAGFVESRRFALLRKEF